MEHPEITIQVYDKREKITATLYVEQLAENKFRLTDNVIFNKRLSKGAEFETRINTHGDHEIIRITKESAFVTKRFLLPSQFKKSDYEMLGDELAKRGGFWQVDFGSIVTVNIPKDVIDDFEQAMRDLCIDLNEFTE